MCQDLSFRFPQKAKIDKIQPIAPQKSSLDLTLCFVAQARSTKDRFDTSRSQSKYPAIYKFPAKSMTDKHSEALKTPKNVSPRLKSDISTQDLL
ncbi:unnamed protein product [Moneuplotes crassus]|uniref:Uncharacterized protein n=1 Tax=Euplotes crassus TaxID=5936 RepID=A0AAD1XQV6_EUPCR|nr:unnamed protein product [Moneuplotes crassus]